MFSSHGVFQTQTLSKPNILQNVRPNQRGPSVQVDKVVCGSTQGSSTLVWRNKRVIPWKWLVLFQTWWLRLWKMAPIFPLDISWLKPHTNNFQHFYFFHAPTNQPARSRRIHVGTGWGNYIFLFEPKNQSCWSGGNHRFVDLSAVKLKSQFVFIVNDLKSMWDKFWICLPKRIFFYSNIILIMIMKEPSNDSIRSRNCVQWTSLNLFVRPTY